jgi:thiamine-phosphate pyrophosphorylase
MDLYLITPPRASKDELSLARHFLECGLHKLHIRKPLYNEDDFRQYIISIPPAFHPRLVLHGVCSLVNEFPSIGIHLRGEDRQNPALVEQVRQMQPASLSTSFHAWEEIMEEGTSYDYVFISPVFDSISKQGYKAGIDLAGHGRLKQWALQHEKQLPRIVALGGINATTLPLVQANGFDGAAVLGAVWESANPIASFEAIAGSLSH